MFLNKNLRVYNTVVPAMNGHPRDQAKVSVQVAARQRDGWAGEGRHK